MESIIITVQTKTGLVDSLTGLALSQTRHG